jgi:Tfp pilus assembly protein FimT
MTLTELLAVLGLVSALAVMTVGYSLPLLARETMRSAMHDTLAALQIAKMEAAARNRDCRLVVNTTSGALRVWDTRSTSTTTDDTLLHEQRLPDAVGFARPDGGSVVTLPEVAPSSYETSFTSQGMALGTGDVFLVGGDRYGRISVHAAGGVVAAVWSDGVWRTGS